MGKTHLSHALYNALNKNLNYNVPYYVNGNIFNENFVKSVIENRRQDYVEYLNKHDILIIENIESFSGKKLLHKLLIELLENFINSQKPIIVTCHLNVDNINDFDDRLKSYLKSGVSINIEKPS